MHLISGAQRFHAHNANSTIQFSFCLAIPIPSPIFQPLHECRIGLDEAHLLDLVATHRDIEKKALSQFTAHLLEAMTLFGTFHTLGQELEVQIGGQIDEGFDERLGALVLVPDMPQFMDERLIDFQTVHGKPLQIGHG